MARFAFKSLFGPLPKLAAYKTERDRMAALASGRKPIERWSMSRGRIEDGHPEFQRILDLAFKHGLLVTLREKSERKLPRRAHSVAIYLHHPDQAWRIEALEALHAVTYANGRWTFAAEDQESKLLGYTDTQRARWLDALRWDHIAFNCRQVYLLLDEVARDRVIAHDNSSLGTAADLVGMTLLNDANTGEYLRRDAWKRIPRGLTLARVGVTRPVFDRPTQPRVTLSKSQATKFRLGIATKVQLLTKSGWR